ncbi:MAG: phosphoglycolate phosphatase [Gammaproteobacteria bacterium]|jgi:phosphoglycolate phosphatase
MNYQGIVFDKDGTLLDFNKTWLPVYKIAAMKISGNDSGLADELLHQHGFQPDLQRFIGGSLLAAGNNHEIAEAWAVQCGKVDQTEKFSIELNQIFQEEGAKKSTPVHKLAPTLKTLKSMGFVMGVATADSYQGILNTLNAFDVLDQFDFLAGYDSGYGVKPGGGMVTAFCRHSNLPPEKIIVVGDNRHDIEMGKNANAGLCIGVLTGTSSRVELETIADLVLNNISELPAYLSQ